MSDKKYRISERDYCQGPGDAYAHAKLLRLVLAAENIHARSIILGAYLGHPACKILFCDEVKPKGVIYRDRLIKNVEINDLIDGLNVWGFAITYRAALGISKLINSQLQNKNNKVSGNTDKLIKKLGEFINDPDDNSKLQSLNRQIIGRRFWMGRYSSRQENLQSCLGLMVGQILRGRSCIGPIKSAASFYDDDLIKKAIRNEVYPFILGEYV